MIQQPTLKKTRGFTKGFKTLLIAIGVVVALIVAVKFKLIPSSTNSAGSSSVTSLFSGSADPVVVGVNTWGGYVGGQYFNGGFPSTSNSRYITELKTPVEFKVDDVLATGRQAFLSGQRNVLWCTVDALPTEINHLKVDGQYPKVFFQCDWSRGGDAIVAKNTIHSVKDLRGKKVAVAFNTPSHSLLLKMLDANDMTVNDVELVKVDDGTQSAAAFQSGNVDAAVVWSPDDIACVEHSNGTAHVLISTKEASHIITDVFIASENYIKSHHKELVALVKGWLTGAAEINSNPSNLDKAATILGNPTTGYTGLSKADAQATIQNAHLCTFGDNKQFFGTVTAGIHARDIYESSARLYARSGYLKDDVPDWSQIYDGSILADVDLSTDGINAAEGAEHVVAPATVNEEKVFTDKKISIEFPSGSAVLTADAQDKIRSEFLVTASSFSNMPIRVIGNTDNVGDKTANKALSRARAQAVAEFIRKEGGFDAKRIVVSGVGSDNPIAENSSPEGRAKNRRTDLQLIKQ